MPTVALKVAPSSGAGEHRPPEAVKPCSVVTATLSTGAAIAEPGSLRAWYGEILTPIGSGVASFS